MQSLDEGFFKLQCIFSALETQKPDGAKEKQMDRIYGGGPAMECAHYTFAQLACVMVYLQTW